MNSKNYLLRHIRNLLIVSNNRPLFSSHARVIANFNQLDFASDEEQQNEVPPHSPLVQNSHVQSYQAKPKQIKITQSFVVQAIKESAINVEMDRKMADKFLMGMIHDDFSSIFPELIQSYRRNPNSNSLTGRSLQYATLWQLCRKDFPPTFSFERNDGKIEIQSNSLSGRAQLKDWFEWVINSSDRFNPYLLKQNKVQGCLMRRRIEELVQYFLKEKKLLAAQFSACVEDSLYRMDFDLSWESLPKELVSIARDSYALIPESCWVIEFAMCLWYFVNRHPIQENFPEFQFIFSRHYAQPLMSVQLELIRHSSAFFVKPGQSFKDTDLPSKSQDIYKQMDLLDLCCMSHLKKSSRDPAQKSMIFLAMINKGCSVDIFLYLLMKTEYMQLQKKQELMDLFCSHSAQNLQDFEQKVVEAELIRTNKDLFDYARFAYQFKKCRQQLTYKITTSAQKCFLFESLFQIDYGIISKSFKNAQMVGNHIIEIVNTFQVCCGYNSLFNQSLLALTIRLWSVIEQTNPPEWDLITIKLKGLIAFLTVKLQIAKITSGTNIADLYRFVFQKAVSQQGSPMYCLNEVKLELSQKYRAHVEVVIGDLLLDDDQVLLNLREEFESVVPKTQRNGLIKKLLSIAKDQLRKPLLMQALRTDATRFNKSNICKLLQMINWRKQTVRELALTLL